MRILSTQKLTLSSMIDLDVPDVTGGTDPTRLTFPSSTTSSRVSSSTVASAIAASTAPSASPSVQVTKTNNATNIAAIVIGAVLGVCVIVLGAVVIRMWMRGKATKTVEQQQPPDMRPWSAADRTAGTGSTSPNPNPYQGYPEV